MTFFSKRYWWNTDIPVNLDDPLECSWHPLDLIGVIARDTKEKAVFQVCKRSFLWFERPLEAPVELKVRFNVENDTSQIFLGPDATRIAQLLESCILFALADDTCIERFLAVRHFKSDDCWTDLSSVAKQRGYSSKLLNTYEMCLADCRERGLPHAVSFGHDLDQIDYFDLTRA